MSDFPNELVEAAAKALYDAEDKHGSGLYGISARAVLAAVLAASPDERQPSVAGPDACTGSQPISGTYHPAPDEGEPSDTPLVFTCATCGGSGDRNGNRRAADPFGTCPGCGGTGNVAAADREAPDEETT